MSPAVTAITRPPTRRPDLLSVADSSSVRFWSAAAVCPSCQRWLAVGDRAGWWSDRQWRHEWCRP